MRTWLASLAALAASAALAQPASEPLTRQELLACVELEDGITIDNAAHDARVAEYTQEATAVQAEGRSIDEAQKALGRSDKEAQAAMARRIEAYRQRVAAVRAKAQPLKATAEQLVERIARYGAACANRPYDQREMDLALAEYHRKSSADGAGLFQAGLKAFDQGRHEEALKLWLPLAERGRAEAQFNVAVMYEQGLGVAKSDVEAARWYRAAAERGDVTSQLKMGSLYEAGVGVAKDVARASFWYGEAAKGTGKDADAARQASTRLAALPKESRIGGEQVTEFEGGRFVLRRAADRECVVALQGTVTPSANDKFDDVIRKAKAQDCARPLTLLLESPGRLHNAGLALGRSVRDEGMRTVARYECASSCATIFLGGTERVLWGARAAIGFHQLALVREDEKLADGRCVKTTDDPGVIAMRRYIRFAVPENADEIFGLVMNTPCKTIEWVRGKRALDLHVATRVEAEGEDLFGPRQARIRAAAAAASR